MMVNKDLLIKLIKLFSDLGFIERENSNFSNTLQYKKMPIVHNTLFGLYLNVTYMIDISTIIFQLQLDVSSEEEYDEKIMNVQDLTILNFDDVLNYLKTKYEIELMSEEEISDLITKYFKSFIELMLNKQNGLYYKFYNHSRDI